MRKLTSRSRRPVGHSRESLTAALTSAKAGAEEDYQTARVRRFEAEGTSGELEALAIAATEDAEKTAERSAARVARLEGQLARTTRRPSWLWGVSEEKRREMLAIRV